MTRSKKIFLVVMFAFFAFLIGLVIDISRRTTFPGSKSRKGAPVDTVKAIPDTIQSRLSPKSATQQP